jgi:hypothetical protein
MTILARPKIFSKEQKWWSQLGPWIVGLGTVWGLIVAIMASVSDPTPENFTLTASVWIAGLYTLGLRVTRRWWQPKLANRPLRNAIILGAINAAIIETEFLCFEKAFGAQGVAAHPNLIVDLIMTMPWYILMVLTFVKVQHRWRFSAATMLFLGSIYELGADGIVGPLLEAISGTSLRLLTLEYWLMMALMGLWLFIPVYSSILLPPAWLVATTEPPEHPTGSAWRAALKPLLWLLPFTVYVIVLMFIIFAISG